MTDEIERLKARIKNLELDALKLPPVLQRLSARNHQQEREMARQQDEIERLKEQLCSAQQ